MNKDIRVLISFKGHRKRKRLKRLIGPEATDYLIDLWITIAMDRPSGILDGWDKLDIADAAGWPDDKDPQQLVDALVECGWLEYSDGAYSPHDWEENQGWVVGAKARSEKASNAAKARWEKRINGSSNANSNTKTCSEHCGEHGSSNAPSPSPSPSPSPKKIITLSGNCDAKASPAKCPHEKIIGLYNNILPELPQCKSFSENYRVMLRTRWREDEKRQSLEWWEAFFKSEIKGSDFLMGKKGEFQADLTWIVRPKNFSKIINGNYRNKGRKDNYDCLG